MAINGILELGYNTFVEIGPHPVLSSSLRDCIKAAGKDCRLIHTLRRNLPNETLCVQRAAISIHTAGCDFDWTPFVESQNLVGLPNYQWQRERYWIENDRAAQDRINPIVHPILGTQEALASAVWRNDFDHQPMQYLRDHVVSKLPILPAAGYLESLLELAALQYPNAAGRIIRNLEILAPMIIHPDRGLDFTTTYDPRNHSAIIRSQENGKLGAAQIHVAARIAEIKRTTPMQLDWNQFRTETPNDVAQFYRELNSIGLSYGPMFQTVRELHVHREQRTVLARIEIDPTLEHDLAKYQLHPTMLDGCFQTLMAMLSDSETTYLPTNIGELCHYVESAPSKFWCVGRLTSQTPKALTCDLTLTDDLGNVLVTIRGLKATAASKPDRTDQYGEKVKLQILGYEWEQGESLAEPKRLGHWLLVGNAEEASDFVAGRLESYGASVVGKVSYGEAFEQSGIETTVRLDSLEDARQVLNTCGQLNGVVFFSGIDRTLREDCSTGETSLNAILTFLQAMLSIPVADRPRVYLATQMGFAIDDDDVELDPGSAAIDGFARVAANELEGFRVSTIDLPIDLADEGPLEAMTLELICDATEDEVAIRGDIRWVSELRENKVLSDDVIRPTYLDDHNPIQIRPLRSDTENVGMVRVLAAAEVSPQDNEILIRVEQSLLPFNLIMDQTSDQIAQPCIEIVGTVIAVGKNVSDLSSGTRVCGFAPSELASHLCGDRNQFHLVPIPADADAAKLVAGITLPACAQRGIETLELEPDETALVWVSEMGLAVAKALDSKGVKVTLVSDTPDDIDSSIKEKYPIYLACPESIERAVVEQTGGQKFTGLVAGLQNWARDFDFRLIAEGGWIVDTDTQVSKAEVPDNVSMVTRTAMGSLLRKPQRLEAVLRDVVQNLIAGIEEGPPTFNVSVADIAWQALPLSETKTRIVIDYDTRGQDLPMVQSDDFSFRPDATYLITGGFGGFGERTAEWLIQNGAKHLVLTGRSGANTPEKQAIVSQLESLGASVIPVACDTSDIVAITKLIDRIEQTMPPLKGVFHSGAVIMDQAIGDCDLDTFNAVMRSKATGAWNLHLLTKSMELDHFVLYSSLANLIGNSRQAAYCAANGFLNGLAQLRKAEGLPATSVNWGAIGGVGVVAQDEKLEQFLRHLGLRGIETDEALSLLRLGLSRHVTQFGVVLITSWADWARFESIGSKLPRFKAIVEADIAPADSGIRDQLIAELAPLSPGDQADLMAQLIQQIVAAVLKSEPDSIDLDRPINELGIDSLMATEIQILFESNLGLAISVLELIGDTTIRSLAMSSLESLEADLETGNSTGVQQPNDSSETSESIGLADMRPSLREVKPTPVAVATE